MVIALNPKSWISPPTANSRPYNTDQGPEGENSNFAN